MNSLVCVLLLAFIGISSAVVYERIPVELEWDACPTPRTVQNFRPSRFAGDWYDSHRYVNALFTGRCGRANFRWINDRERYNMTYTNLENSDSFILRPMDLNNGIFRVYRNGRRTPVIAYVLDTDYDNYSIIWTCTDVMYGVGNAQTLNIFTRKSQIDSNVLDTSRNVITNRNLDVSKLRRVNQKSDVCGRRSTSTSDYDDY